MPSTPFIFSDAVLAWFAHSGRKNLPWQQNPTPYRVWISEIMLQQTQVQTVMPYYERFMASFPDIFTLAKADLDEVLHLWTGLGYYARARNLHKCSQILVQKYQGEFPYTVEEVCELPGIGLSTAGAILSLSRQHHAVIMDGNVKRVLARFFALDSTGSPLNKILWVKATELTPQHNVHHYTQAMMDLGATLCTRSKPACLMCPLSSHCQAHAQQNPSAYPVKVAKKQIPHKTTTLLIFLHKNEILLEQRPTQGIWGGLWSFPESSETLQHISQQYGSKQKTLQPYTHTFSHFHLTMQPLVIDYDTDYVSERTQTWCKVGAIPTLGLPAPIKQILLDLPALLSN